MKIKSFLIHLRLLSLIPVLEISKDSEFKFINEEKEFLLKSCDRTALLDIIFAFIYHCFIRFLIDFNILNCLVLRTNHVKIY